MELVLQAHLLYHGRETVSLKEFAPEKEYPDIPHDNAARKIFAEHVVKESMRDRAVKCLEKAIECGKYQQSDLHADIRNSDELWILASALRPSRSVVATGAGPSADQDGFIELADSPTEDRPSP